MFLHVLSHTLGHKITGQLQMYSYKKCIMFKLADPLHYVVHCG